MRLSAEKIINDIYGAIEKGSAVGYLADSKFTMNFDKSNKLTHASLHIFKSGNFEGSMDLACAMDGKYMFVSGRNADPSNEEVKNLLKFLYENVKTLRINPPKTYFGPELGNGREEISKVLRAMVDNPVKLGSFIGTKNMTNEVLAAAIEIVGETQKHEIPKPLLNVVNKINKGNFKIIADKTQAIANSAITELYKGAVEWPRVTNLARTLFNRGGKNELE